MGYTKIVEDAKGIVNLIFTHIYNVRSLSYDVRHNRTTPSRLTPSSTTGTLFNFFDYSHIKQDDLAPAFSATSLTELEQNYSSGLVVENNMSLFAEIPKYFYFVSIYFPPIIHPKR